jgi:hypothetical protein
MALPQSEHLMNIFMMITITKEIILKKHTADFFKNYKIATIAPMHICPNAKIANCEIFTCAIR